MAVIRRTGHFSNSIRLVQGIVWFLVLLRAALPDPQSCSVVKKDLLAKGFPAVVLDRPQRGPICGEDSCCTADLEQDIMLKQNQLHIEKFLRDSISKLHSLIELRARKFDSFFREMMNNSKREFHDMFQRTYGKIYLQNSDVFSDFFAELETYYKKGAVRLSETLETFFGILYQRMFTVINSQYSFDEKYLECVSDHMTEMKPFGDVPHKLSMQLKRSFVATRTYYKALLLGVDVAARLADLKVDEDCLRSTVAMQHCGICKGRSTIGACSAYCTTTMETCFRHHTFFNAEWDKFIDAVDKVADRLIGPFNIEMVVDPLNIKISEAVMIFQESGTEVSKKIYSICGKPMLNRRKRKTNKIREPIVEDNPKYEIKYDSIKLNSNSNNNRKKKTKKVEEEDDGPTLEKLIKEIKVKIRETRQFWLHLPYQYCNNPSVAAPPSENGHCWNGTDVGSFDKTKTDFNNSNYIITKEKVSPLVGQQIYSLQMLTDKLRKAHQGDEVEIVDDSDESLDGSGSGSGEGPDLEVEKQEGKATESPVDKNGVNILPDQTEKQPPQPPKESPSTTRRPDVTRTHSSSANANTISLSRALAQYLLPIVLVWFGGAISDIL